jgi:hypothetical protein
MMNLLDEGIGQYQGLAWRIGFTVVHADCTGRRSISCGGYAVKTTTAPIPFASSQLNETRHVCTFFNSDDEEYRVCLPLLKDGSQCGHKAILVFDRREQATIGRSGAAVVKKEEPMAKTPEWVARTCGAGTYSRECRACQAFA